MTEKVISFITSKWMQTGFFLVCVILIARDWYKDKSIMEFQREQQAAVMQMQKEQTSADVKTAEALQRLTDVINAISK